MPSALKIGDRVELLSEVNLQPYTTVRRGERGIVDDIDDDGNMDIRLDACHPGLACYDNCMWVHPPYSGNVRMRLVYSRPVLHWSTLSAAAAAAAITAALFLPANMLGLLTNAHAVNVPAIEYQDFHAITTTVPVDGRLIASVTSRRNRACLWEFYGTWEDEDTHTVMAKEKHAGTVLPVSSEFTTHNIYLDLPKQLPPGHYSYASLGASDCDSDGKLDTYAPVPTIYFTVVE